MSLQPVMLRNMGWLRKFTTWQNTPVVTQQEPIVTFSHDISVPRPIDDAIVEWSNGARISRDEALRVPAVLRGRNLICSIATLPLETRDKRNERVESPFLKQINPNVTNIVTLSQTVEDLVFEAVAWWRVLARNAVGRVVSAEHIPATSVTPDGNNSSVVWVDGVRTPARNMIKFESPNPAVLDYAGRAIKRAVTFERSSSTYANDPRANDYFTPADGADPVDDDEVEELLDEWARSRRRRSTAYVPAALKYHTIDAMSPADLQLVELQRQVAIELSNVLGIDPEDFGVSTTSRTYANRQDRYRDRINDTLSPYMQAITQRLSMDDVTLRGQRVTFDLDDYLKADAKTRWETHAIALANRVLSVEEIRNKEDEPAIPVERKAPSPNPSPVEVTPVSASLPKTARFTNEYATHATVSFEMDEPTAAFRVNREKRTISGLLIPWNKVGKSMGRRWQFNTDSLHWSDVARIKLNREHDRITAIAVATRLQNTPTGLDGSFRVARGDDGDRVLALAEDGVLDGFSVEVDFADGDQITENDDGTVVVSRGTLRGVAITSNPAYDDARVTSVAATREGNQDMKCSKCGHVHAPNVACTAAETEVQATSDDNAAAFTAALETQNASFSSAVDALTGVAEKFAEVMERPAVVESHTAQFRVNEALPYRFDGNRGEHDFSTDLISMSKKDHEAEKRVVEFIKEAFNRAEFVDTADVGTLNPTRQRPDLYVDELQYPTPIWDSLNKGTLPDNTPFVLPKFNASGNLVNDHTEGDEPTTGTFTTTSQTITPSAVSGKVEVTREAWDQGGNPQLSVILWRQIVREYYEALEQAAATMLNNLSPTVVTLTAGATDKVLAGEVRTALAKLHFVRGGFRFRDFKLAGDLYTALADAADDTGRSLFPVLGASNADGTMGPLFGSIAIGGLPGTPAWALPNTVVGTPNTPSASYLYNREDVHGWASAPQRLDFEYRVAFVDIGVWGYKALAATRAADVRRIDYDDGSA